MPDLLPNETIAAVIPKLFTQVDYGFLPSDFGPTVKVPAAFQIRCWEVKEPAKYLTPEQCEAVAKRKAERQQIRRECVKILKQMDDTEKLDLLKGEKSDKVEKSGSNPESKGKPLSEVVSGFLTRQSKLSLSSPRTHRPPPSDGAAGKARGRRPTLGGVPRR